MRIKKNVNTNTIIGNLVIVSTQYRSRIVHKCAIVFVVAELHYCGASG